jgi:peptide deformylase
VLVIDISESTAALTLSMEILAREASKKPEEGCLSVPGL